MDRNIINLSKCSSPCRGFKNKTLQHGGERILLYKEKKKTILNFLGDFSVLQNMSDSTSYGFFYFHNHFLYVNDFRNIM